MNYFKSTLGLSILLLLSSCIELEETFYINSDGSMKVELTAKEYKFFGRTKPTEEQLKKFALTKIKAAIKHADAVTNVSYSVENGTKGSSAKSLSYTAYYSSFNDYTNSALSTKIFNTEMQILPDGALVFEAKDFATGKSFSKSVQPRELSPEELKQKVEEKLASSDQEEKMMAIIFENLYMKKSFHLNGEVISTNNIELTNPNTVIMEFDGKKMFELFTNITKDEVVIETGIREKYGMKVDRSTESLVREKFYGNSDPLSFKVKANKKALFKYEKEVKSARAKMSGLLKDLGEEHFENKHYQIKDNEGKVLEEGVYKYGLKDGLWKEYFDDGKVKSEKNYKKGAEHGIQKEWYENGQMKEEVFKVDNKANGISRAWYDNGQLKWEYTYKEGQWDGIFKTWYENGKIEREENYSNGYPEGEFKLWSKEGILVEVANYKDKKQFGVFKLWWDNGNKREESNYITDNIKDGLSKEWSIDGKDSMQVIYKDGEIWEGTHKAWYYEKPQSETTYKKGEKHGLSRHWGNFGNELEKEELWKNGELKKTKFYENGELIKEE